MRMCDTIAIAFEGIAPSHVPFGLLRKSVISLAASPAFARGTPCVCTAAYPHFPTHTAPFAWFHAPHFVCQQKGECTPLHNPHSSFHLPAQTLFQALHHALVCMGVPVCICASNRSLLILCSPALPTATAYRQIHAVTIFNGVSAVLAQHNSETREVWFVCCVKVLSFALSCCQYSLLWGTRQPLPFLQWLRTARRFIPVPITIGMPEGLASFG